MAEPVSALPNPTTPKGQTVPWPNAAEPLPAPPEIGDHIEPVAVSERLRSGFQDYYGRFQTTASNLVERSRLRFRYMKQERPMQIVVGVAIASLLAGAALRIWRSNHD